jgi:hypothetical protein
MRQLVKTGEIGRRQKWLEVLVPSGVEEHVRVLVEQELLALKAPHHVAHLIAVVSSPTIGTSGVP